MELNPNCFCLRNGLFHKKPYRKGGGGVEGEEEGWGYGISFQEEIASASGISVGSGLNKNNMVWNFSIADQEKIMWNFHRSLDFRI